MTKKPSKKPKPEEVEAAANAQREDEILRRMLNTPPTPHKPKPQPKPEKKKGD